MKHETGSISSTNNDREDGGELNCLPRLNTLRYLAGSGKAQCRGLPNCVSMCSTGELFSTHSQEARGSSTSWTQHGDIMHSTARERSCPSLWESEQRKNKTCHVTVMALVISTVGLFPDSILELFTPGSVYLPVLGYLCAAASQCSRPLPRSNHSTACLNSWILCMILYCERFIAWNVGLACKAQEAGYPFCSENWPNTGR